MSKTNRVTTVQLYTENSHYVAIGRTHNEAGYQAKNYSRSSTRSRDRLIKALEQADYRFTPFYDGWGAWPRA